MNEDEMEGEMFEVQQSALRWMCIMPSIISHVDVIQSSANHAIWGFGVFLAFSDPMEILQRGNEESPHVNTQKKIEAAAESSSVQQNLIKKVESDSFKNTL